MDLKIDSPHFVVPRYFPSLPIFLRMFDHFPLMRMLIADSSSADEFWLNLATLFYVRERLYVVRVYIKNALKAGITFVNETIY
jgi:hypothetical protein